ncbi:hypothetical protein [Microlunatus sp. Gsoil 973]|uniref:hypothetical protein n=1 Tax=Microlunatus sp. Gsoil 973 TaxID=2672569 RepID=UPI0012B4C1EC|nr:hypothetical protein [Microlunatus sp. Gsoil 973]QGN34562.1 hypothetical protein GJV80_18990 [Microlunatus sp. Gsoil 973]
MSSRRDPGRQPTLGRRIGRQLLTVLLGLVTLGVGAALTWASLAPPRESGIPDEPRPCRRHQ